MSAARPRVVVLRGHSANLWDLRPWELLADRFDVRVLVTGSNLFELDGLGIEVRRVRSVRDPLPAGRGGSAVAYAVGERYIGLKGELQGADIVHSAEIGTWFSAQAAALRRSLGFRLALTVWETIPWRSAWRWPRERRYLKAVLPAADLFLPTSERAALALRLEGVGEERIRYCPPGIDVERFARAARQGPRPGAQPLVLSAGRLVWEKGHQDVLRAAAVLAGGLDGGEALPGLKVMIVGAGPEAGRLRRYAEELGIAARVEFRESVPYDEMPQVYARASALVLASLPRPAWEEQFGMVLVEAMAAGLPVMAASSGAIPEVVGGPPAELFAPGDWPALAGLLRERLADRPGERVQWPAERLARFSREAEAERLAEAYESMLGR